MSKAHAFRETTRGDKIELKDKLKTLTEQLEDRKRANVILNTENLRLKKIIKDIELRLADLEAGRPGSVGETTALKALRSAASEAQDRERELAVELEYVNQQLVHQMEHTRTLEAQLSDFQDWSTQMEQEAGQLRDQVASLEKCIHELEDSGQVAGTQLQQTQQERNDFRQQLQQLQQHIKEQQQAQKQEMEKAEQEKEVLQNELGAKLDVELASANQRINESEARHKAVLDKMQAEMEAKIKGMSNEKLRVENRADCTELCYADRFDNHEVKRLRLLHRILAAKHVGDNSGWQVVTAQLLLKEPQDALPRNKLEILIHGVTFRPGVLGTTKAEVRPLLMLDCAALGGWPVPVPPSGRMEQLQHLIHLTFPVCHESLTAIQHGSLRLEAVNALPAVIGGMRLPSNGTSEDSTELAVAISSSHRSGALAVFIINIDSDGQLVRCRTALSTDPEQTIAENEALAVLGPGQFLVELSSHAPPFLDAARTCGLFDDSGPIVEGRRGKCQIWSVVPEVSRRSTATKSSIGEVPIRVAEEPCRPLQPLVNATMELKKALQNPTAASRISACQVAVLSGLNDSVAGVYAAHSDSGTEELQMMLPAGVPAVTLQITARLAESLEFAVPLWHSLKELQTTSAQEKEDLSSQPLKTAEIMAPAIMQILKLEATSSEGFWKILHHKPSQPASTTNNTTTSSNYGHRGPQDIDPWTELSGMLDTVCQELLASTSAASQYLATQFQSHTPANHQQRMQGQLVLSAIDGIKLRFSRSLDTLLQGASQIQQGCDTYLQSMLPEDLTNTNRLSAFGHAVKRLRNNLHKMMKKMQFLSSKLQAELSSSSAPQQSQIQTDLSSLPENTSRAEAHDITANPQDSSPEPSCMTDADVFYNITAYEQTFTTAFETAWTDAGMSTATDLQQTSRDPSGPVTIQSNEHMQTGIASEQVACFVCRFGHALPSLIALLRKMLIATDRTQSTLLGAAVCSENLHNLDKPHSSTPTTCAQGQNNNDRNHHPESRGSAGDSSIPGNQQQQSTDIVKADNNGGLGIETDSGDNLPLVTGPLFHTVDPVAGSTKLQIAADTAKVCGAAMVAALQYSRDVSKDIKILASSPILTSNTVSSTETENAVEEKVTSTLTAFLERTCKATAALIKLETVDHPSSWPAQISSSLVRKLLKKWFMWVSGVMDSWRALVTSCGQQLLLSGRREAAVQLQVWAATQCAAVVGGAVEQAIVNCCTKDLSAVDMKEAMDALKSSSSQLLNELITPFYSTANQLCTAPIILHLIPDPEPASSKAHRTAKDSGSCLPRLIKISLSYQVELPSLDEEQYTSLPQSIQGSALFTEEANSSKVPEEPLMEDQRSVGTPVVSWCPKKCILLVDLEDLAEGTEGGHKALMRSLDGKDKFAPATRTQNKSTVIAAATTASLMGAASVLGWQVKGLESYVDKEFATENEFSACIASDVDVCITVGPTDTVASTLDALTKQGVAVMSDDMMQKLLPPFTAGPKAMHECVMQCQMKLLSAARALAAAVEANKDMCEGSGNTVYELQEKTLSDLSSRLDQLNSLDITGLQEATQAAESIQNIDEVPEISLGMPSASRAAAVFIVASAACTFLETRLQRMHGHPIMSASGTAHQFSTSENSSHLSVPKGLQKARTLAVRSLLTHPHWTVDVLEDIHSYHKTTISLLSRMIETTSNLGSVSGLGQDVATAVTQSTTQELDRHLIVLEGLIRAVDIKQVKEELQQQQQVQARARHLSSAAATVTTCVEAAKAAMIELIKQKEEEEEAMAAAAAAAAEAEAAIAAAAAEAAARASLAGGISTESEDGEDGVVDLPEDLLQSVLNDSDSDLTSLQSAVL